MTAEPGSWRRASKIPVAQERIGDLNRAVQCARIRQTAKHER
jgi:hypothetical protein